MSDVGIAVAYASHTLFAAAIAVSSSQILWRSLRVRSHAISQIDALLKTQTNPFSPSLFRCGRSSLFHDCCCDHDSLPVVCLDFGARLDTDLFQSKPIQKLHRNGPTQFDCADDLQYIGLFGAINSVVYESTYLPPLNPCNLNASTQCSYSFNFSGPGLDCSDVTASSNYTAFTLAVAEVLKLAGVAGPGDAN